MGIKAAAIENVSRVLHRSQWSRRSNDSIERMFLIDTSSERVCWESASTNARKSRSMTRSVHWRESFLRRWSAWRSFDWWEPLPWCSQHERHSSRTDEDDRRSRSSRRNRSEISMTMMIALCSEWAANETVSDEVACPDGPCWSPTIEQTNDNVGRWSRRGWIGSFQHACKH